MKKAAIAIIFSPDRQQVLLVQRRDIPVWVLPGGGIDNNETALEAVEREVYEETGIAVETVRLVGTYLPVNSLASETKVFECRPKEPFQTPLHVVNAETRAAALFPTAKLPKLFFFLHQEWVQDALEQRKSPLVRYMTHITWWALLKQGARHPLLVLRYLLSRFGFPINN